MPDGGTLRRRDRRRRAARGASRTPASRRCGSCARATDKPQPVGTFPAGVANPLLLYFLETTVRATAEATGGSPYYIRNRIREALVAADLGPGDDPEGAMR